MEKFNALPDLVLRGILSQLVVKQGCMYSYAKEFKGSIYILHVSRRWRRLGVPLVYKTAFAEKKFGKFGSNIELISELGIENLVKGMGIGFGFNHGNFSRLLGPLFDIFKLGSVDWSGEDDSPPSKEIQSKILILVQCLVSRFPRVLSLNIELHMFHPYVIQLTNQLVTLFSDRLVSLYLSVNTPVDLEYFPVSLRHLTFVFNEYTGHSLPKIQNPSKLQHLTLRSIPYNVYLEDLIPMSSEFTNLRSLHLNLEDYEDWEEIHMPESVFIERSPPPQRLQLILPQLVDLSIRKPSEGDSLKFEPVQIPSRLNKVYLDMPLEEIDEFCRLPIEYIRHISFSMEAWKCELDEDFYAVTNKLLGEMDNSGGTTSIYFYSKYGCGMDLDVEQIEWYNVTELYIGDMMPSTLFLLLAKLPLVICVVVEKLKRGFYKHVEFQHISQVEKIRIEEFESKWSTDGVVEFIATLLKQHDCVNNLWLPKNLVERIEKMIGASASTYPHWQQITVAEAKRPY